MLDVTYISTEVGAVSFISTLLIRGGIEQNPGPGTRSNKSWINIMNTGTCHQGDTSRFHVSSVGRQCVTNSVVFLIRTVCKDVATWRHCDMDAILLQGDSLYRAIEKQHELLEICDIPANMSMFGCTWQFDHINSLHCAIDNPSIQHSIDTAFEVSRRNVIFLGQESGSSASGIIAIDGAYLLFDPHSRSTEDGLPAASGTSILARFESTDQLSHYIHQLAMHLHAIQMTISMVNVDKSIYVCDICMQHCDNGHNLKRHRDSCLRKQSLDRQTHVCSTCQRVYNNAYNLQTHVSACHVKQIKEHTQRTYKCDICKCLLDNAHNLHAHVIACRTRQINKANKQKSYTCPVCERTFNSDYNMQTHLATHRSRKPKYSISDSEHTRADMRFHPYAVGHKDRVENITKCKATTTTTSDNYMCSQCKKCFDNAHNRDKHSQACHISSDRKQRYIQRRRSDIEFKHDEQLTNRQRIEAKRSDRVYRRTEMEDNQKRIASKRKDPDHISNERENNRKRMRCTRDADGAACVKRELNKTRMKSKRNDDRYRHSERSRNLARMKTKRSDSEYVKIERASNMKRMEHYRSDPVLLEVERDRQTQGKKRKRSQEAFCEHERNMESIRKRARRDHCDRAEHEGSMRRSQTYGTCLSDAIDIFLHLTSQGPIYVCTSCLQTMFVDDVDDVSRLRPGAHSGMLNNCRTGYLSVDNKEWLCHTCKRDIYKDLYPKMSKANKMGFPERPPELELHPLEETLIAPLLPFMTIRSLPVGGLINEGQKMIIGNVVHVPNDVSSTVNVLPRNLDEMGTIPVKLKRKKQYKTSVFQENIRPAKVLQALRYLTNHSEMYQRLKIQMDEEGWLSHLATTNSNNRYFVEGQDPPMEVDQEEDDEHIPESGCDNHDADKADDTFNCGTDPEQIQCSQPLFDAMTTPEGNMDTMLDENNPMHVYQDVEAQLEDDDKYDLDNDGHRIYNLAPGEGQTPVYRDAMAEYKCYPTIFCGQERPANSERHRKVTTRLMYKSELRHVDPRVNLSISNIMYKAKRIQIDQIASRATLALRRTVGAKHKKIKARDMLNAETRDTIKRLNEGYRIFRSVRNSPPYFEQKKKELNAMVRQIGYPTLFFSLSSADTRWEELIQCLGKLVDKKIYTIDEIRNRMPTNKKHKLVSEHPTACSRYFHHRVEKFMKLIVMGPHSPFGTVKDYFYRVEFQKRGSPHIHGFLWIDGAPDAETASHEDICKYIDSVISCDSAVSHDETRYLEFQEHHHTHTCVGKKRKSKLIKCRFGAPWPPMGATMILEPLDPTIDTDVKELRQQYAKYMDDDFVKKIPLDVQTFQDWLDYIHIEEDEWLRIVRSSLERRTILLKRGPHDTMINNYMKGLLSVWKANHDIQFVLNTFQCVSYICDYMTKSQKGMSELLRAATEEARSGNMDLRKSVRHIGNKFVNASESPVQQCIFDILPLPITNSTRKKEFIHTGPVDQRVGLVKSIELLEEMDPDSEDILMSGNIDRYMRRPRMLEHWTLAEYVAKTDIQYVSKRTEQESDNRVDEEEMEAHELYDQHVEQSGFPYTMRSGNILRLRQKEKIIRFRNFSPKTDLEEYYRERLMLYTHWRKESELMYGCETYEGAFMQKEAEIRALTEAYERTSGRLEQAYEEYFARQQAESFDIHQTITEVDEDNPVDDESMPVLPPDQDDPRHQVDIGHELGIAPTLTEQDETEYVPLKLSDNEYYRLVGKLNKRQQEFHNHIMHMAVNENTQTTCVLHGGAGTGKSTVIHALSAGLQRFLQTQPGKQFDDPKLLLAAITGKAAYNINGETIHRAFRVPVSKKLVYKPLKWESISNLRSKFHSIEWILIDEFSMLGNSMLRFIDLRLQEIRSNKLPFGGLNMILIGDLHQLKPVKDGWIFKGEHGPYEALAPNIFHDNFDFFELDEIMRQRGDVTFAEMLNRIRTCTHTPDDIQVLRQQLITEEQSTELTEIPHFFAVNERADVHNRKMLERTDGRCVVIHAVDVVSPDFPRSEITKAKGAARNQDSHQCGNLRSQLVVKEGVQYDLTANIDPSDGLVNSAGCIIRYIDELINDGLPRCIWVEFQSVDVGQKLRSSIKGQYRKYAARGWTPIQPITRRFTVLKSNIPVTRLQFPLEQSSGRTIHKAQSATHEAIVVDLSPGSKHPPMSFWSHMHYVAFSRCTTLQGLHITCINEDKIRADNAVKSYIQNSRRMLTLCYEPMYSTSDQIKVAYNNVCSIRLKWPALHNDFNLLACDFIIFAETWLAPRHPDDALRLSGFNMHRMDSTRKPGHRGMLMYTARHVQLLSMTLHQTDTIEVIHCVFSTPGDNEKNISQVVALYKPPTASFDNLLSDLRALHQTLEQGIQTIVIGDFNIDAGKHNGVRLKTFMQSVCELDLMCTGPTTWESTTIDLSFTNVRSARAYSLPTAWSKHHNLFVHAPVSK